MSSQGLLNLPSSRTLQAPLHDHESIGNGEQFGSRTLQQGGRNSLPLGSASNGKGVACASLELSMHFLQAVMDCDYRKAKLLCEEILSIEPTNEICIEYYDVLQEALLLEAESSGSSEGESLDDETGSEIGSSSCDASGSDQSTELSDYESPSDTTSSDDVGNGTSEEVEEVGGEEQSDAEDDLPLEELKRLNLYVGGKSVRM